jgi:16S rRNA (adenine1518-N6/adenine1519-N6)-dimethyltransferase
MAQTKAEIQALLAAANTQPRHRFGQNFMIDANLVRIIADAGGLSPADLAIEVGPGTGTLTEELLARAGKVLAVEIDRDLATSLRERLAYEPKFSLIEGDALDGKHALHPDLLAAIAAHHATGGAVRLVANLPYNIASPLVIELLLAGVDLLAFTVQKEVADRLRAGHHTDDYGPLTVMTQLLGKVEVLRTLPPQAFWPPPKIDSALVRITSHRFTGDVRSEAEARAAGRFVQGVFAYRRKTLRKALDQSGQNADTLLAATGLDGTLRPECFSPTQLLQLFRAATSE